LSSVRLFDRGRNSRRVLPLHWHQAFAKVKKQSKERQKSQQFKTDYGANYDQHWLFILHDIRGHIFHGSIRLHPITLFLAVVLVVRSN
jgi:hypothetical protein